MPLIPNADVQAGPTVTPDVFRQWMSSFATGVTVVLVREDDHWHAMTANAFTSVSLKPPLVLLCVEKRGHTYPLLRRAGLFTVSILSRQQEALSQRFASLNLADRTLGDCEVVHAGGAGMAALPDALAWLACEVVEIHEGGDHGIFVAEAKRGHAAANGEPLLFFRGAYR